MTLERERPGIAEATPAPHKTKPGRRKRWLLWIGIVLVLILLVVGGIVAVLLHRAEPILRAALVDNLESRFHARVELDEMHLSIVDGFQVECGGLRIWLPKELTGAPISAAPKPSPADANRSSQLPALTPGKKLETETPVTPEMNAALNSWRTSPWIVVSKMRFHASWRIRPGEPIVISVIHVNGVQVLLPPKEDRPHLSLGSSNPPPEQAGASADATVAAQPAAATPPGKSGFLQMIPKIVIKRVECDDALLVIERNQDPTKKAKLPLEFRVHHATLVPDGHGGPVAYNVELVNAKPIGIVKTAGHFGPWVPGDPGALPLNGEYHFDHADLSTIHGIAGNLSSSGQYSGGLRRIDVTGQTWTPDFRLERVSLGSGVPLNTRFHAVVDGTNGDTWLQPVEGMLGHTHILARGQVVRTDNPDGQGHGHDIQLVVTVDRGRIEDILEISANRDQPFMTGNLTLGATHFHLPPGKDKVWEKLSLDGDFHISQARFSNNTMQARLGELSLRGQGKPKEAKSVDPTTVLSNMQGHFQLNKSILQLPDLVYQVPGAQIMAHGAYGLTSGTLAFEGDARLEASLSHVVGGWKGFLLKPADRWLRKNGAGTDVPIHINGTRKQPKFGVDFGRLGKSDDSTQLDERRH